MGWIRSLFQLQIFVYSGACNHFCLLHEVRPPSLISSHKWRFPHALSSLSVCVESLPAISRVRNAQHRLQAAHKTECVLENGAWRPQNQTFLCITSNVNFQQLIFYYSAQHTSGFKSSSRYESIDYWQTNHPEFIWRFKGFV